MWQAHYLTFGKHNILEVESLSMKEGAKYLPLYSHLRESGQDELTLSFSAIEALLGERLPATARTQRAWWSNRSRGAVQAAAWMTAGYHVETLDLAAEEVTFRKPGLVYKVQRQGDIVLWDADLVKALRHHMGLNQAQFAKELGIRQPTVSEWETGAYEPRRSSSKLLSLVAEKAGFQYE
jgi:DNA-binding XRE family transcriptional regulator